MVALAQSKRDIQMKLALERDVRLVRFEEGRIEFELAPEGSREVAANLMRRLAEWTGARWMVSVVSGGGAPTIRERTQAEARAARQGVEADPAVRMLLDAFPGAEIVAVRSLVEPVVPPPVAVGTGSDDEIGYGGDDFPDDDL